MYRPKHFKLYELVDEHSYNTEKHTNLWNAFDARLLQIIDLIREELGVPLTINNWKWGKDRQWSGLRNPTSKWYSTLSQHSFGRAIDFIIPGGQMTASQARSIIRQMMDDGKFNGIVDSITLEHTLNGKEIGWVHIDVRYGSPGYNELHI